MANYAKDQPAGFTNRIRNVAIVGAGGAVGQHIAERLVKTGQHTVTALTRAGSTSKLPEGVRAVSVNYDDDDDGKESSLVSALEGQDILIITLSITAAPDTQSKLVQAAATAGVQYVMPNSWGCDILNESLQHSVPVWDRVAASFREVEQTGVSSWIALVCGFWYEHSLVIPHAFGFDLARKKLTLFDDGNTKMNISTKDQVGRAVSALLSLKVLPDDENDDSSPTLSTWWNKPVYISSFLLSQRDMFESWKRVTGETDGDWTIEHGASSTRYQQGLKRMKQGDRSGFVQAMYSRIFFPSGDGVFERKGLANSALGLPTEDLDEQTRNARDMVERGYNYFTNRN